MRASIIIFGISFLSVAALSACDAGSTLGHFVPQDCASVSIENTITIYKGYVYPQPIDLAVTDDGFGAVWNSNGIWLARLDTFGNLISEPSLLEGTDTNSNWPSISWTGDGYAVTFFQSTDNGGVIQFVLLGRDGQPISSPIPLTDGSSYVYDSKIAVGSGALSVIWLDDRHSEPDSEVTNDELYFRALNNDGVPQGSEVRLTETEGTTLHTGIVYTGGSNAISYIDKLVDRELPRRHQVFIILAKEDGTAHSSPLALTDLEESLRTTSIAWSGEHIAVTFSSGEASEFGVPNDKLELVLIDDQATGVISRDILASEPDGIMRPQIEWTGSWYAVGYMADSSEGSRTVMIALAPTGDATSKIIDLPIDIYNGLVRFRWANSSFGILCVADIEGDLELQFRLAACIAEQ